VAHAISIEEADPPSWRVTVTEGAGRTVHEVTVRPEDVARYAPGAAPERLLQAAFEFLLAREPKEAILRRFDLPVIERYFPEFRRTIRDLVR
jgi:hypothetical protein